MTLMKQKAPQKKIAKVAAPMTKVKTEVVAMQPMTGKVAKITKVTGHPHGNLGKWLHAKKR